MSARSSLLLAATLAASIATLAPPHDVAAQSRTYRVRSGDTLARIARRFHVSISALQRANRMRSDTIVRPGERLEIPGRGSPGRGRSAGRRHTVRPGDTLARIANRYHVSIEDLQVANRMRSETIRPGEVLMVPRPGQTGEELRRALTSGPREEPPPAPVPEDEAVAAARRAEELGLGGTPVGQQLLREAPDPRWVEAAGDPDELDGTLGLPLPEGRFLRGWGSGPGGYHLAVDIGAMPGTEVHAAERGIVAYAGHGIRGYGYFVILVHPNGWVTAYAHHQRNMVVPGQMVERGDVVGLVGQTGRARGPHLHMILAYEGEHCDPVPLFRPRVRRASGEEVDEPVLAWETAHRPSGIQCLPRSARPHPFRYSRERRRRRLRQQRLRRQRGR